MGTKKIITLIGLISFTAFGQKEIYVRPGLLTATATISPSFMLNRPEVNYYISGYCQGRLDNHFSFRGETHYFVDGAEKVPYLNLSSRTYFGILGHLSKGNFDSHIGFMPGISVMQMNGDFNTKGELRTHVVPSYSANIGVTYYVWKVFNFFANFTYVNSNIRQARGMNGKSDEFMISAGLGFNVNTVRAK